MALEFTRDELFAAHGIDMDALMAKKAEALAYAPAPLDERVAASDWKRVLQATAAWQPVQGEKHATVLLILCLASVLGVPKDRAAADLIGVMNAWPVDQNPADVVPGMADWSYAQEAGPTAGQLAGTLRHQHGVQVPELEAEQHKVIVSDLRKYKRRYPTEELSERRLAVTWQEGINVVCSPMDTGKTYAIEELLAENPDASVLYVSHLISLAESVGKRLGIDAYTDMQKSHYRIANRLSICVNSLPHLIDERDMAMPAPPDILVIDEVEQVLRRFTDRTIQKKGLLLSVLKYLVARTPVVIAMDAHVSDVTMRFLENWRSDKPMSVVHNTYKVATGRTLDLLPREGDAYLSALDALAQGGRVWFCTNQKNTTAEGAVALFKQRHPEKTFLLVSSDTTGNPDVQAFLKDPNGELRRYDGVIATPSINSGVSIDEGHDRTWVGGSFGANSNTPSDVVQALGRVRGARHLQVHIAERHEDLPTEPEDLRLWQDALKLDAELLKIHPETGVAAIANPDYEALYVDVKINENKQRKDFRGHVLALAQTDGYTIAESGGDEQAKKIARDAKELAFSIYVREVKDSPDIDEAAAAKLRTPAFPLTSEQVRTLDRYDLRTFYVADPDEVEHVAVEDERGKLKAQITNLAILKADDATLRGWREADKDQLAPDLEHAAIKREILRRVLDVCGFDPVTWDVRQEARTVNRSIRGRGFGSMGRTEQVEVNSTVTYSTSDFKDVISWLERNRRAVSRVMRLPPMTKLRSSLRWVGSLLASVGFKQTRSPHGRGHYSLDTDRIAHMRTWFERSEKGVAHLGRLSIGEIPKVRHSDTVRDTKTDFRRSAPLSS